MNDLKSLSVILLTILTSFFLIYYSQELPTRSEAQAAPLNKEIKPFVCENFDEIVKVEKCDYKFNCKVLLKSGKRISYHGPVERELIPCQK